jgi:[acyl-carrier-protein] S-malonyltransferase
MMYLQAQGVTNVYEVGAGKVLSGIARRFDGLQAANVGTPEELEAASTALAG